MTTVRFVTENRQDWGSGQRAYQSVRSYRKKDQNPYITFKLCNGNRNLRFRLTDLNDPNSFNVIVDKLALRTPNTARHVTDLCNFYLFYMEGLGIPSFQMTPHKALLLDRIKTEAEKDQICQDALKGSIIRNCQHETLSHNGSASLLAHMALSSGQLRSLPTDVQTTIDGVVRLIP